MKDLFSLVFWGAVLYFSFGYFFNSDSKTRDVSSVPEVKEKIEFLRESCNSVSHKFGVMSDLTDLQLEAEWPSYKNKVAVWSGSITSIDSDTFSDDITVQIKCLNSRSLTSDVVVSFPDHAKDKLLKLRRGSTVDIKLKLTGYTRLLGLYGEAVFD